MADNSPNKRKCTEGNDGWRTTRGQTNGDTLVTIARDWFTRHYLIEQHLNGFLREENASLMTRMNEIQQENARLRRSNSRFRVATNLLHDQLTHARNTVEFQRRLLVEIFDNHPDVRAIYEADLETEEEVLDDTETEEETF